MLVLRRTIGQAIRINDNIRIVIQDIQDGRIVRFAIEAPPEISVHRLEIYRLIQAENQSAASANPLHWLKGENHANSAKHNHENDHKPAD